MLPWTANGWKRRAWNHVDSIFVVTKEVSVEVTIIEAVDDVEALIVNKYKREN